MLKTKPFFIEAIKHECNSKKIKLRWVAQSMMGEDKNVPNLNYKLKNEHLYLNT